MALTPMLILSTMWFYVQVIWQRLLATFTITVLLSQLIWSLTKSFLREDEATKRNIKISFRDEYLSVLESNTQYKPLFVPFPLTLSLILNINDHSLQWLPLSPTAVSFSLPSGLHLWPILSWWHSNGISESNSGRKSR